MFESFIPAEHPRMRQQINFFQELNIYPASFAFREDIENGDKILLPSSALNQLYPLMSGGNKNPMVFCLKNGSRLTYCGVLQFVAEQGLCYIPSWMFKMLKFPEAGSPGTVTLVPDMKKKNLKTAYFIKLRPHLTKFIDLENPKAVLQYQLRNFTCLHQGDTITISTFSGKFEIDILQIKPKNEYNAICIIDTDVEVDFAPPLDYQEPTNNKNTGSFVENQEVQNKKKGNVFAGNGVRIDEKKKIPTNRKPSQAMEEEEYDPRKHRIHRGVRKNTNEWIGTGVKIGVPMGSKKK